MDLSNENIIHVKKDGIEYLQFRILLDYGITNCYTTRVNNLNFSSLLESKILEYNLQRICDALDIDKNTVVKPKQKHTDVVERVDKTGTKFDLTDGLVTNKSNINIELLYADCTPVLIYDPVKKAIANIHSGWKGTAQKISQKGVVKMQKEFNSDPKDLIVCLGPCIKEDHFEVEDDVKDIFEREFSYLGRNEEIIKNIKLGKYLIDTTLINELILEEVGVKRENIFDSGICTVCSSELLHSYRADKELSGRNIAIIGMK